MEKYKLSPFCFAGSRMRCSRNTRSMCFPLIDCRKAEWLPLNIWRMPWGSDGGNSSNTAGAAPSSLSRMQTTTAPHVTRRHCWNEQGESLKRFP